MNDKHLTSLLQRFMDGATTVDEETVLADFFRHATDTDRPDCIAPDDWRVYRQMFAMFESGSAGAGEPGVCLQAPRHIRLRHRTGWIAAAAAVALLVVGGLALLPRHDGGDARPLAEFARNNDAGSRLADSVATERSQRISADSMKLKERPKPVRKNVRPYWQPRPPKVYVAEAAKEQDSKTADNGPDDRQIDEAVKQAEALLKAISMQQAAELKQLELQAMECLTDGDDDAGDGMAQ